MSRRRYLPERDTLRRHPDWNSPEIQDETLSRLLRALHKAGLKWRRSVDVLTGAINRTIDNEADALETIKRIEEKYGRVD